MGGAPSLTEARAGFAQAFDDARARGEVKAMVDAALALAALQRFGEGAGRVPALLHEVYAAASPASATRARLAAALGRCWAYANEAPRGRSFAREAVEVASALDDATLLADALDAELACSWGPDDLAERRHASARLQDVAAHVDVVKTRLDAHLWRLVTALETLDVVGARRQLAALDLLAEETGSLTVRFFAASRRAMHAQLVGDYELARELMALADRCGEEGEVPDAYAVHHTLTGDLARHCGDLETLAAEAGIFEEHALRHGIQSLLAETAVLWLAVGDTDRTERLLLQAVGAGLSSVARDVDWMLTVTQAVEAAAGVGHEDLLREGVELLAPYAGRAVLNAGAVNVRGVVEDYLHLAGSAVGDPRAGDWGNAAAAAYRRLDAPWWQRRVAARTRAAVVPADVVPDVVPPVVAPRRSVHLRQLPGQAVWVVGRDGSEQFLPDMKGLRYLHALVQRPGVEVSALELSALGEGRGHLVDEPDLGAQVDRQALSAYRQRLHELDAELDEAASWSDPGRVDSLSAEREALLAEVRRATGLGGRVRTSGGSGERARVAVRKALRAALDRIEMIDPATARLLQASVRSGAVLRYDPDPDAPVSWVLQTPG